MSSEFTHPNQLPRNIFHVICVSSIAFSVWYLDFHLAVTYLGTFCLILIFLDFLRRMVPFLQKLAEVMFGKLIREEEKMQLSGASYALMGSFVSMCVFPKEVAVISILMLALGDPASNFVGLKYGKDKIVGNKSLQGSISCFLVCALISCLCLSFLDKFSFERLIVMGLLAGLIGATAELVSIFKINDNFMMPTLSGCGIWILFKSFGVM